MADDEDAIIEAAMALFAYDEDIQLNSVLAEKWSQLSRDAREDYIAKAGTAVYTFMKARE